jgi:hypothetical protein
MDWCSHYNKKNVKHTWIPFSDAMCAFSLLKGGCHMHPEVRKFVDAFNVKMERIGRKVTLNENELQFLEHVYGPEFSFNFSGLIAQLPYKDYKGGNRYIDFYYENGLIKIIIEIDSYKYHVESLTPQQYDDHQERQNDLLLTGEWVLLRFTANMLMKKPMVCRRQLMQGIGKCIVHAQQNIIITHDQLWEQRKSEMITLAGQEGIIKTSQVVKRFSIDRKTANRWLQRMTAEGALNPVRSNKFVTGYVLPSGIHA